MLSQFPSFSHLYIERDAWSYSLTNQIRSHFPKAQLIEIENYRSVFNRPKQDWRVQKESQKLIIAVKHGNRIHPATEVLPQHAGPPLYYTTPVINCVYDCQYCFLQAMYRSANIVVFVNEEDFYADAKKTAAELGKISLSVSYDSDLLASERFIPWTSRWIEFARNNEDIEIEIRTKSSNYSLIKDHKPHKQAILSWSLASPIAWKRYEHHSANPELRIDAARKAIDDGWRVRLCFDPIIPIDGWHDQYKQLLELIVSQLPINKIEDVSVGTFRMGEDHLRNLRSRNPSLDLLQSNLHSSDGILTLKNDSIGAISTQFKQLLQAHFSENQIIIWRE